MRGGFAMRLRPTLLSSIIGLVLVTAAAIGGGAVFLTMSISRSLIEEARGSAVKSAREETRQFFAAGPRITDELTQLARRGVLPFDRRDLLVAQFAERLRAFPTLYSVGYGDVAGWYVGALRNRAGEVVEYLADPQIDGAMPDQVAVAADGTRSPPTDPERNPYLVVNRPWFKSGIVADGPIWSPFYTFITGATGITATSRFVPQGASAPRGVFAVDLQIDSMAKFLTTLSVGRHGAVFLVDRDGHRVVDPSGENAARTAAALDAAAAQVRTADLEHPTWVRSGSRFYEVIFEPVPTDGDVGLSIGVVVDLRDVSRGAYRHGLIAAGVAFVTVLLAAWLARRLSLRIANPIVAIAQDLGRVGAFSISREPAPRSFVREVSELGASVDRMKASLRSFAHYVPTDLVRRLLAQGQEAQLGAEPRRLTIYFSDIANFTTIAESMEPERLIAAMGRYLEQMTGSITRHGGTVDKFIGDGIMAFFNAPEELLGHPRQACLAALEGQRLLAETARTAAGDAGPAGEPVFRTRIGLALGEVLVGNIGTPERFAYTLLGDEVNLASRLEGLNKAYGTAIIASEAVMDEAGDGFEWRRLDRVAVKGRSHGTLVCELLGVKGEVAPASLVARDHYERALDAYFAAAFERAASLFDEAARLRPEDSAAPMMAERARLLAAAPPPGWDGVHVMHEK